VVCAVWGAVWDGLVLGVGCRVRVEGERDNSGSCTVPVTPAHNVAIL
jgi:hypothetical protein